MKKLTTTLFFTTLSFGALFFVLTPSLFQTSLVQNTLSHSQFASVFFIESIKPEVMRQTVALANVNPNSKKLRILVVPGHDSEYWGTQYLGLKEATVTLELGKKLAQFLSADGEFKVILARDDTGYNPLLSAYFTEGEDSILDFAHGKKQIMNSLISDGKVEAKTDGVYHNNAPSPVVIRLYGINKWANENDVDLV
ncbi:MAG: N-acetylmuramoyl-L-alanine amidase, partial [Candidatus Taylorbacteria bacterium]|nr:N-acetylmuramoyl-L-alanine amidase [Candidatus Taylorbacteria bacterium]